MNHEESRLVALERAKIERKIDNFLWSYADFLTLEEEVRESEQEIKSLYRKLAA